MNSSGQDDQVLYFIGQDGTIMPASAGILINLTDDEVQQLMDNYSYREIYEMARDILIAGRVIDDSL